LEDEDKEIEAVFVVSRMDTQQRDKDKVLNTVREVGHWIATVGVFIILQAFQL
jgi:hypothetical protein